MRLNSILRSARFEYTAPPRVDEEKKPYKNMHSLFKRKVNSFQSPHFSIKIQGLTNIGKKGPNARLKISLEQRIEAR